MLTISNRTGKKAREMNETKKVSAVDFFCIGFGGFYKMDKDGLLKKI